MAEYISREAVLKCIENDGYEGEYDLGYYAHNREFQELIEEIPAADVVEVVRCKDCYYWTRDEDKTDGFCLCDRRTNLIEAINLMAPYTTENDYCSWGEREEG